MDEVAAYEYLWLLPTATIKRMDDLFRANPGLFPSELVESGGDISGTRERLLQHLKKRGIDRFGWLINGTVDYPHRLLDAGNPVRVLYYQGDCELLESNKLIAVIGSRKVSREGVYRTRRLVELLVGHGYTIVSGLAEGVDTAAHTAAIESGGRTIAVIGTPIGEVYPKSNRSLYATIADRHLLVSQVPVLRHYSQDWRSNRAFFAERNKTMSALTQASVIVEATETSGALIQARAAFEQGRELFVLASCFSNSSLTWPQRLEGKGARRVHHVDDILSVLEG